jgi:5'-nucleotidase
MTAEPSILLTNDDGIDAVGIRAVYNELSDIADITVVAPASDQSAVGRKLSNDVAVSEHEIGYAVEGTPADCVIAGLEVLTPEVDMVVAGCNKGANIGAYVLGRSGTVSAAVESAFFDVPAIAVSMYIPGDGDLPWHEQATSPSAFAEATRATRFLIDTAFDAGVFEQAEYLNLNAPSVSATDGAAPIEITRPSMFHDMGAEPSGDSRVTIHDRVWERMRAGDIPDPQGTDRRAVVNGSISVSPLTAPHSTEHHESLDALAAAYPPSKLHSDSSSSSSSNPNPN